MLYFWICDESILLSLSYHTGFQCVRPQSSLFFLVVLGDMYAKCVACIDTDVGVNDTFFFIFPFFYESLPTVDNLI